MILEFFSHLRGGTNLRDSPQLVARARRLSSWSFAQCSASLHLQLPNCLMKITFVVIVLGVCLAVVNDAGGGSLLPDQRDHVDVAEAETQTEGLPYNQVNSTQQRYHPFCS